MNALAPLRWDPPAAPEPHRFTLDEVIALRRAGAIHPDLKLELLDGEIIEMPEEGELHVWFKVELNRFLVRALGDDHRLAPDSTLSLAPTDAPSPDIYVFPTGAPLRLTPGHQLRLLIEIADSSLKHDLRRKAAKYADYAIPEYWVIDLNGRRTHVHLRPEQGGYGELREVAFGSALRPSLIDGINLVIADLPRYDTLNLD